MAANETQDRARRRRKSASPADRSADPSKRRTLRKLAALGALAVVDAGALASCGRRPTTSAQTRDRLILLGIDGLDPGITARMMAEGKLPNMLRHRMNYFLYLIKNLLIKVGFNPKTFEILATI